MRLSALSTFVASLSVAFANPKIPTITKNGYLPKHFGVLVYPGFTELDVYGPVGVLQGLNGFFNLSSHLSIIANTMDPVSTIPLVTTTMNMSHGDFGEAVVTTTTIDQVLANDGSVPGKGPLDVLLVPGGVGSREPLLKEIEFVKAMYPKVGYLLSVCTGATLLARSGVLDGHKATTNKKAWAWATSTGPNVTWVHTARWVPDGNIWTSSGVSAGIDLTYAWVGHVYGEDVADYVAMTIEYKRWYNASDDPFAAIWNEAEKTIDPLDPFSF